MSSFLLEIITPERIAYTDEIDMVTAPSAAGVIGILPHHVPLFTRLVEGELRIVRSGEDIYLAIGGGFMEVTKEKVVILVTEAYHAHEINEKELEEAKKRAEEALSTKPSGEAYLAAQQLLRRTAIVLKVAQRRKHGRPPIQSL